MNKKQTNTLNEKVEQYRHDFNVLKAISNDINFKSLEQQFTDIVDYIFDNLIAENLDDIDEENQKECLYLYAELERIDQDTGLLPKKTYNIAINETLSSFVKRNTDNYPYKLNIISFKRIFKTDYNRLKKYNPDTEYIKFKTDDIIVKGLLMEYNKKNLNNRIYEKPKEELPSLFDILGMTKDEIKQDLSEQRQTAAEIYADFVAKETAKEIDDKIMANIGDPPKKTRKPRKKKTPENNNDDAPF